MLSKLIKKSVQKGFTLVELMVVVAIIGVLAAIAIPNYQKYQARARQSEAKVNLASLYTAQQSYYTEQGTFTGCLRQIGFDLNDMTNANTKRFYTVGFSAATAVQASCGPVNGTAACSGYMWDTAGAVSISCAAADATFIATARMNLTATLLAAASLPNTTLLKDSFTATASGSISAAISTYDNWTINQSKFLTNIQSGI